MTKISFNVDQLKTQLKERATQAKAQIEEFAKKAQKDFAQTNLGKRAEEILKNPKVIQLTKRISDISEQVSHKAAPIIDQVKSKVAVKATAKGAKTKTAAAKKSSKKKADV